MSQLFDSFIFVIGGLLLIGGLSSSEVWSGESAPRGWRWCFFDNLAVGDSVAVRSLSFRPSLVRLEAMTSNRWIDLVVESGVLFFVLGAVGVFGGILLYGGSGLTGTARKAAALLLLGAGGVSCWRDARPFDGGQAPRDPAGRSSGRATRVRTVAAIYPLRQSPGSRRGWYLTQPYQIVETEFTPAGARAPVVAVDAIDQGSIPKLTAGSIVALDYDRARPRTVRLHAGTRTWSSVNLRSTWLGLAVIGAVIVGLFLIRVMLGGRKPAGGRALGG